MKITELIHVVFLVTSQVLQIILGLDQVIYLKMDKINAVKLWHPTSAGPETDGALRMDPFQFVAQMIR